MSQIFGVTTDYLLKPSEIDELSVGIYLIFLAVYFIGHFYFEIWNPSIILAEFLIVTVIVVFIWANVWLKKKE